MTKQIQLLIALLSVSLITACGNEPTEDLQDSIVETTPETAGSDIPSALFDPSSGVLPFPTDLLFSGTADGTLNIPGLDDSDLSNPQVALNSVDGFSTNAPLSSGFSTSIDSSSVGAESVKLYQVTAVSGVAVAVTSQLTYGVDFLATVSSVDSSESTLAIVPLRPFPEKTSYTAVVTDSLMTSSGEAFAPSITYRLLKNLPDALDCSYPISADFSNCQIPGAFLSTLAEITDETEFNATLAAFEGLRQVVNTTETTIASADGEISADNIIQSWSFTTQSVGDVLAQVRTDIRGGSVPTSVLVDTTQTSPLGAATIYAGTVDVPYYLTAATSTTDQAALDSFWSGAGGSFLSQYNTNAVATSTESIPLLASVPMTAEPVDGYPVVIFQHGITSNRATMMALADAMASAGMAVVAIDMPMHGLTGVAAQDNGLEGFYQSGSERTFDLDLVNNATSAPGPDTIPDPSGTHFINLSNLQNTRDNVRQAVSDLFTLTYALEGMTAGGASFDSSRIYFIGHSLGAIVGMPFLSIEDNVRDAALVFGGGAVAKILDGSAAFGPRIEAGLAGVGVDKGTADFESFLGAAQTVVDTADPLNYATEAVTGRGVLFFEIVGSDTVPSDLVVPNSVVGLSGTVDAPLAGTEPLLTLMGLTQVDSDQAGSDLQHSIKFVVGNHSSLLSDAADDFNTQATNSAVRTELQTIIANFLASDGAVVNVNESPTVTLLQTP